MYHIEQLGDFLDLVDNNPAELPQTSPDLLHQLTRVDGVAVLLLGIQEVDPQRLIGCEQLSEKGGLARASRAKQEEAAGAQWILKSCSQYVRHIGITANRMSRTEEPGKSSQNAYHSVEQSSEGRLFISIHR